MYIFSSNRAIEVDRILVDVLLMNVHLAVFQLIELSEQESKASTSETSVKSATSAATASTFSTESGTEISPFLVSLDQQISESIIKFKALQTSQQTRSFSLVKAVGQAALSAAIGVVKTIGFGASAIIEARRETLDHNTKLHFSSPVHSGANSPRGNVSVAPSNLPSDMLNPYDDGDGETDADLVSRLNLTSTTRSLSSATSANTATTKVHMSAKK